MPIPPEKNPAPPTPDVDSPLNDLLVDSVYKWFTDWLGLWSFLRQRKEILTKPEILCSPDYPAPKDKTPYQFLIQGLILVGLLSSIIPFTLRIIGTSKPPGRSAWDLETEVHDLEGKLKSADAFDSVWFRNQLPQSRKDAHNARVNELQTRFSYWIKLVCFPLGIILSAYVFRFLIGHRAKVSSSRESRARLIYIYLTPAILFWVLVAESIFDSATDTARQLNVPERIWDVLGIAFWPYLFGMPLMYLLLVFRMSKVVCKLFGFGKARSRLSSVVGAARALVTVTISWLLGYFCGLALAIASVTGIAYITEAIDRWKLG